MPGSGRSTGERDRLPTPVLLGFPFGSASKESSCNAGDLGWEDPLEKLKGTHSSIPAWRFHGLYSPWGRRESDTTERFSLHFTPLPRSLAPGEVWHRHRGDTLVHLEGLTKYMVRAPTGICPSRPRVGPDHVSDIAHVAAARPGSTVRTMYSQSLCGFLSYC